MTPTALAGRRIVITRPAHQAQGLANSIRAAGGEVVVLPLLEVSALDDVTELAHTELTQMRGQLANYAVVVFVSSNAIDFSLPVLLQNQTWPLETAIAVMGESSLAALRQFGLANSADLNACMPPILMPQGQQDSEALLRHPALASEHVAGRKVLILRGNGGRPLLGDVLRERGAEVRYLTCYRRSCPSYSPEQLAALWQPTVSAICISSSEGLRNLWQMLDVAGRAKLAETTLVVPHARIADEARRLGLAQIQLSEPGDSGILACLARL